MAIPVSIEALLNENVVESNRIEFKEGFNPDRIIRTVCAFANDIDNIGGGYIVVRIGEKDGEPDYPPAGIEKNKLDSIQKELLKYCNKIQPRYLPVVEVVQYQGQYLLVIWVKGGYGRPYQAPEYVTRKDSDYFYYIRKMSNSVRANQHELRELFSVSEIIPFDDRANPYADLDELDKSLFMDHLKEAGSSLVEEAEKMDVAAIARKMQLISGPPEFEKPVNAAVLFFTSNPQKYFRYARIEVVYLPDPTGEKMQEKTFTGPVQIQLKQALDYIRSMFLVEQVSKQDTRAEADRIWNYPFRAVEEILSNAVYHRSYEIKEPITVRITMDRIEVTSHPGFDSSIRDQDIEQLRIQSRVYRNRRLGDLLKEIKLIEGRNTGFPNAIKALKLNGSPQLKFEYDKQRQFLSVIIPVHPSFSVISPKDKKLLSYQEEIKRKLAHSPMTMTELAIALGYKGITAKLRKNVNILLEQKDLEYITGGKGQSLLALSGTAEES